MVQLCSKESILNCNLSLHPSGVFCDEPNKFDMRGFYFKGCVMFSICICFRILEKTAYKCAGVSWMFCPRVICVLVSVEQANGDCCIFNLSKWLKICRGVVGTVREQCTEIEDSEWSDHILLKIHHLTVDTQYEEKKHPWIM